MDKSFQFLKNLLAPRSETRKKKKKVFQYYRGKRDLSKRQIANSRQGKPSQKTAALTDHRLYFLVVFLLFAIELL